MPENADDSDAQRAYRRAKVERAREQGVDPIAYGFDVDTAIADIRAEFPSLPPDSTTDRAVAIAGRLTLLRKHGGLTFAVVQDRTAAIQLFVDRQHLGTDLFAGFDDLDRGDWLGVKGVVMTTRRGELSVRVDEFALLGKAIRPLPDKDKAFDNVEVRFRQRYVDLMVNDRTRRIFEIRRKAISAIRAHLEERGFWEVEGPILQSIQGGATARPFITHHNAMNIEMYLRIALELHLKRLVVGGMERVFEIGRVFRNEGVDTRHNPEFTMLEAYQAYADYTDMMDLVEGMVVAAARNALGDNLVVQYAGEPVDLSPPWPRLTMAELMKQHLGVDMDPLMPIEDARRMLDDQRVPWEAGWGPGRLMKELYDEKVQHSVRGPVFCIDYPQEVSPLARAHRSKPGYVERFELIVAGFELCNAYSEQNDPAAQLAAFEDEARAKAGGDPEAGDVDLDYVRALEYGMPCTGGLGIGIDRLIMLLAGVENIREVILFPTLRPEHGTGPEPPSPNGHRPAVPPATSDTPAPVAAQSSEPRAARPSRVVQRVLAGLTALGGAILLLTLVPVLHSRLAPLGDPIGPLWFRITGHVLTMLIGLALLFLAGQLGRGKRRAWQICVALFALGTITNILKGPHPISALYSLGMTVALIRYRRDFRGAPDPPSLLRLIRLIPVYIAAVFAFGFVSLVVERDHVQPSLSVGGAFETIAKGVIGLDGPYTYERRFFRGFFPNALLVLGIAGLVGLLVLLFRPLRARRPHTTDDWSHARRLVKNYGWDTLAYFALRDDKSFFFSSDGEAMLAYTYVGGYALVSGDPIGAPASIPRVVDEFSEFCDGRSWRIAYLAVRASDREMYTTRGFRCFYLGDEAIIHCDTFSLDGRAMKSVRAAVRRVGRAYRFELVRESEAPAGLVDQLNAISQRWRGKAPERGFTMTLSQDVEGDGSNPDFLLCVARDENGAAGGFLRLVPAYGRDFGYTLDLMRHDPDAPNGMTEFLIASAAVALRERGVVRLSMNFAMWGRLFQEGVSFSPSQRAARRVVGVLNPFFQIKSLQEFNAKFSPAWLSRDLIYQQPADLPRVGLLYAGAEGFLALPVVGPLFVPKAVGGVSAQAA
ncbi:MAG TPA: lysine--tRNA ligase [Jatrophihabitantaceae bacterium]